MTNLICKLKIWFINGLSQWWLMSKFWSCVITLIDLVH